MQFRVLGPLEVDAGEGPIPLGGPKQRAVLANLLIRANQVVPADVLISDVWGEETPEKARHILQTYVSNLRKTLGDGRLEGRPSGYLLIVDPFELDAARFDALVADAKKALPVDPNVAITTFEDALAIWRGPALADLTDQPSLLAEAARLDELRIDVQEDRIEGLLATGEHSRALGELEPILARHPLRESLWGLAMLASYRAGRQADALNAYGRARELLADELGIDPSPELARLHERILKQDPGLDLRGEPLRGYRLLEKIGSGPYSVVFRGVQPRVGRDVAVKVFNERIAADAGFIRRFERDAQIVAALEHPHIAPIYDHWREPGRAYLVSRYMRGGSLRALRERGATLERERALRIVAQVASALGFAHRQGVAHGSVGSANVLLDGEGNAYLADFRVGADPAPDPSEDLRELRQWSRDLLSSELPPPLDESLDSGEGATGEGDADAIAEVARSILEGRAIPRVRELDERNPYKGLRAFAEADAIDFFGRTELTQRLLARLNETGEAARFLAVVGASGSGKSSVVRAGLVPALRGGGLAASSEVFVVEMFPGAHPWDELEAALVRIAARPPARLGDLLRAGSRGLLEAVELVTPPATELVLIVDQFEELFTLTPDERERELFLESLRVSTVDPTSRLRVIATIRADQYDRPLIYPRFGELFAERNETVPPLTADELEQSIRRPAERQGVSLEPGLVAEMIADVAHQPGGLPLLQYALTELFERRDGDLLTLAVYREIGGVTGALSARADRLYTAAGAEGRRAIEQVLLRLVALGEGRQDTRRRVAIGELDALDVSDAAVASALESYGRHRLLTFDREPSTRDPTVEIAHEALLRAWGRLASWIDAAREDIRQNERLVRAGAEWRGSGADPSFLMSGARLDQVEAWVAATTLSIGLHERAYVKASVEHRDRGLLEEEARRDRETMIERRSVRRLRGLVAVFAGAALVAGSLTIVATNQGGRAERAARISSSRELAAASVATLGEDPERSILLALEAIERTRAVDGTVLPEAEEALHRAVVASRIVRTMRDDVGGRLDWSPMGVFVAQVRDGSGTIDIRDTESGQTVRSFRGHDGEVTDFAFSRDGSLLATGGSDGMLKVWDPSTGELVHLVEGRGRVTGPSFDRDGTLVAAAWTAEDSSRLLDLSTGQTELFQGIPRASGTALSPDGSRIAVSSGAIGVTQNGTWNYPFISVFELSEGEEVLRLEPRTGIDSTTVTWSPDGRYITGGNDPHVWDAATGRLRSILFGHTDEVLDVDWSRDSSRLVTGSFDGTTRVWDFSGEDVPQALMTLSARDMRIVDGVAFSPDGMQVMAGDGSRGAVTIWDVGPSGDAEWANLPIEQPGDPAFTPSGHGVFVIGTEGSVNLWDPREARDGVLLETIETPGEDCCAMNIDVSSDGATIAIGYWDGTLAVRSVATAEELFTVEGDYVWTSSEFDLHPSGELLAVADRDGSVKILDFTGRTVRVLREGVSDLGPPTFSPDGRLIATAPDLWGDPDTTVLRIWDWERARVVTRILSGSDPLSLPVFDPTARLIATYSRLGRPDIWDVQSGRLVATLARQPGDLYGLAFSPDGSAFATGSTDGTVRLFDVPSGLLRLTLHGPAPAGRVAFSPDGSMLASRNDDRVRIWALDIDDLIAIARQNVTRSLTDEECRQYLHAERCPGG